MIIMRIAGRVGNVQDVAQPTESYVLNFTVAEDVYDHGQQKEVTYWFACAMWAKDRGRLDKLAGYLREPKRYVCVTGEFTDEIFWSEKREANVIKRKIKVSDITLMGTGKEN